MIKSKAFKYVLYGTMVVISSEIVYRIVRKWLKRLAAPPDISNDEISEVIWTNELTLRCTNNHEASNSLLSLFSSSGEKSPKSPESSGNSIITDGSSNTVIRPPIRCNNIYCTINNIGRLVELIDRTQYSIDLAMYIFTSYELSNAIGRAHKRGVDIRILSDPEMVFSSGSQITSLTKSGIPVRSSSTTMLMHHKFCVLDGPLRAVTVLSRKQKNYDKKHVKGIVMSGSLNWTSQAFGGNWENIIISSNKKLVNLFESEFERMWISFKNKLPESKYSYKRNGQQQQQ